MLYCPLTYLLRKLVSTSLSCTTTPPHTTFCFFNQHYRIIANERNTIHTTHAAKKLMGMREYSGQEDSIGKAQTYFIFSMVVSHVWDVFGMDYSQHEVLSHSPFVTMNHKSHSSETSSKPNVRFTSPPQFLQRQDLELGVCELVPLPRCWLEQGT